MTSVLILQHGEKESGPGDPGLTPRGRRQADSAAAALAAYKPAAIASSPLLRARQTAMPLATMCGLAIATDPRLRERLNHEGSQDLHQFFQAWQATVRDRDWSPPEGRSSRTAAADFMEALDTHAVLGRAVVLASHGGATVDLLRHLLGDEELELRAPGVIDNGPPGAAISTLLQRAGRWVVEGIGRTDHLAANDRTGHIPR